MTGLPKFVRDQMARTPAPSSHPDTDVLTAFAENTLSVQERQQVVDHLSACADCREIVFLAQPEIPQTQTVLAPTPRRFTWMAWASVGAVIVVVGSAVILQHEKIIQTQPPVTVATTTTQAHSEVTAIASPMMSDKTAARSVPEPHNNALHRELDLGAAKTKPASEPMLDRKDVADGERSYVKPAAPAPPSQANQPIIVAGAAPQQTQTGPEQREIAGQFQQSQGPSNTTNRSNIVTTNETLAKADSAPAAKVTKKQRAETFRDLAAGYTAAPAASPLSSVRARWQISPTGVLQRSYGADTWSPVLSETGIKFHVVSVIANTVWAGGENGALYVSRNGGATWNRIAIDSAAAITSIQFSDDLHGKIETANGQVWKTSDRGTTWQKQ